MRRTFAAFALLFFVVLSCLLPFMLVTRLRTWRLPIFTTYTPGQRITREKDCNAPYGYEIYISILCRIRYPPHEDVYVNQDGIATDIYIDVLDMNIRVGDFVAVWGTPDSAFMTNLNIDRYAWWHKRIISKGGQYPIWAMVKTVIYDSYPVPGYYDKWQGFTRK